MTAVRATFEEDFSAFIRCAHAGPGIAHLLVVHVGVIDRHPQAQHLRRQPPHRRAQREEGNNPVGLQTIATASIDRSQIDNLALSGNDCSGTYVGCFGCQFVHEVVVMRRVMMKQTQMFDLSFVC